MPYLIYLRKSRADMDAEARGEGETLARHEKTLIELAKKMNLNVTGIYKEIVSGETIAARPKMQQVIREVEEGLWEGVLVMEVERLARGDTKDQGTVAEAFKFSNTKIITPVKIYDPSNEFDEEYFEFGLFMSRREYKTINRRIQRGRIASVEEGKYIASSAPYGYERVRIKNDKGYTLKIVPSEADIVRLIYDLYTRGELQENGEFKRLGMYLISKRLDSLHIQPRNSTMWSRSTVKDILTNPTYTGKVRWRWRKVEKKIVNGELVEKRPKDYDNCMKIKALHDPIIDEDTFELAQAIMREKKNISISSNRVLQNPFTGLVYCGKCGALMTRAASNTKVNYPVMKCPNRYCDNISSPIFLIEEQLLVALQDWVDRYELPFRQKESPLVSALSLRVSAIKNTEARIETLKKQLLSTYDLLEQGIYTSEVFLERNRSLSDQIREATESLQELQEQYERELLQEQARTKFLPAVRHIIDVYDSMEDASAKNALLKNVIDRIVYVKNERNKKGDLHNINFELTVYPKIPLRP